MLGLLLGSAKSLRYVTANMSGTVEGWFRINVIRTEQCRANATTGLPVARKFAK
jgi:hypothetical protein